MWVGGAVAGGAVVGEHHEALFEEEVFDYGMLPFRSDPRLTDAEHVDEEELDGQTPTCYDGGRGASGTVGLEGADAGSVDAFCAHIVSDARARTNVGWEERAHGEVEPIGVAGEGILRAFGVRVQRSHDG